MILFRKYYKTANDKIQTNRELIDKIFDEYEKCNTKNKKSNIYSFGTKYGAVFAAVLVLCAVAAVYPQLAKMNEELTPNTQQSRIADESMDDSIKYTELQEAKGADSDLSVDEKAVKQSYNPENEDEDTKASIARMIDPQKSAFETHTVAIENLSTVTEEEIMLAANTLEERLGKMDENTGNIYIFEIAGKLDNNGSSYYLGRWRWLVDDHSSLLCEFVMSSDFCELYNCTLSDGIISWTTEDNLFEQKY